MGSIILLGCLLFVPLAILVAIILLVTRKSQESFQKKMDTIYSYIVLLISLVLIIIGVVLAITSITDILLPTSTDISTSDMNNMYSQLMGAIGIILVSIPLFVFHQKRVNKNK